MVEARNIAAGIAIASISAGPIFITILAVGRWMEQLHRPLSFEPGMLIGLIVIIPLAAGFGLLLSIIPNLVGTLLMAALGKAVPLSRSRVIWAMAGALAGFGLASLASLADGAAYGMQNWQSMLPLIMVSAACASICRHYIRWGNDVD